MKTRKWNFTAIGIIAYAGRKASFVAAALVGAWFSVVAVAGVSAQTYYVSPSGSDSNSGLAASTPFRTIGRAASVANAGGTVYIRGGTYLEYVSLNHSGTSSARITFEAYPGETPVVDGSGTATNVGNVWNQPPVIAISGAYVTVRGLEVKNAAADGVTVWATGTNAILDRLHIHHIYLAGIRLFSTWDATISNSVVHDVYDYATGGNDADCIGASWYNPHGRHTIKNNVVYNCSDDGIDMWTASDNLIEGNVVHHAGYPGNGNGNGFKLGSTPYPYGGRNIVRNNVAYDNRSWGFASNAGPDNQVYNNTAFRNGAGSFANWDKPGTYRNNISYMGGNTSLLVATSSNNSWDLGISDPQFMSIDPASPNFLHLQAGSPAIDRGANTGMPYNGSAPDLGAFELGGSSTTPPPPPTPDTSAPSVPSGLTSSAVSATQVNLSWTAVTDNVGVVGYQIYQDGVQVGTASGTTYSRTGLTASTTYSFTVAAYDASGNVSSQSAASSVTTSAAAPPPPSGGVSCPTLTPLNVAGAWSDGGFAWAMNGSYGTPADVTPTATTSLLRMYENGTAMGPAHSLHSEIRTSGQSRYSHYSAADGSGESMRFASSDNSDPRSNGRTYAYCVASASAPPAGGGSTTTPPTDTSAPSVPGGMMATATSTTQIILTWAAATDNVGVVGYKVYRSGTQIATATLPSYSQTGLTAGTTYSYTVAAYDAAGNTSGSSATASATTLSPPPPPPSPAPSPTAQPLELSPSNADTTCTEEFENTANTLRAGDTLVLHGGTYSQTCARVLANLHGTAQQPIVIRAATGEVPVLTRPTRPNGDYDQSNLEIADSSYVTLQGLVFRGGDIGVRLRGTNHHITIENSEIADTGNAGFTANSGDTDSLTLRHNQIHHTGLFKLGATEGEGLYLGCHAATCRVTNSVIEQNYIHDLRGTSSGGNDGIEVKVGSGGNVIRHNVIHTMTIGTAYPCILVYGGGANPNTVEGNVVWQCGEAIVALADAVVRNNIVLQSNTGLASYPHEQVAVLQNVTFVNNTVYGHAECASLRWAGAVNVVLANNALYCGVNVALYAPEFSGPGTQAKSNYVEGVLVGGSLDGTRFLAGGTAAGSFINPAALDFWPQAGSLLRNTADAAYLPSTDFNGLPRTPSRDVGAYATKGLSRNVGWRITPGFKVLSADGTAPTRPRGLRVR